MDGYGSTRQRRQAEVQRDRREGLRKSTNVDERGDNEHSEVGMPSTDSRIRQHSLEKGAGWDKFYYKVTRGSMLVSGDELRPTTVPPPLPKHTMKRTNSAKVRKE